MNEEVTELRDQMSLLNSECRNLTDEINIHQNMEERQSETIDFLDRKLTKARNSRTHQRKVITGKEEQLFAKTRQIEAYQRV
jgi:flagellar biosynthesis chaperone FliJ